MLAPVAEANRRLVAEMRRPGGYSRWAFEAWGVTVDCELGDRLGAQFADRLEQLNQTMTTNRKMKP
jgi:hypothetical protein